ncbi:MAG: DUF4173 domain-containing protein [Lachnospiraceae bacterium]
MDTNSETGLTSMPNLQNVQPINPTAKQQANLEEMKRKEKRFQIFGVGSFLYALFYTFCLYHNTSGITYPFFAGGTLLFFGYFIKKSKNSSAEGSQEYKKTYINNLFLMVCIVVAGALNCTTDSGVLIFFNKVLMWILFSVLFLQCWQDLTGWGIAAYARSCALMLCGTIGSVLTPAEDIIAKWKLRPTKREKQVNLDKKRIWTSVGIGLLIAIPVAMFVTILLASADAVFGNMVYNILTFSIDIDFFKNIESFIRVLFCILIVFVFCYGMFAYNTEEKNIKRIHDATEAREANMDSYIAITVNGVMCVIYLLFSSVQIFGLFLGKMKLPAGYTYASYARRGFFELVFVCIFNILMVLFTMAYFKASRLLRILLTIICGCTYIMTISSAYRMLLYISSYRLTFLRLLVLWGLVMIAIVMTGVLIFVYNQKFSLFRFLLIVATVGWLVFSAAHPDYWIASYNIMVCDDGEEYDQSYLTKGLSLDAVSALPEEIYNNKKSVYYKRAQKYKEQTKAFLGARAFNFSRAYASQQINFSSLKEGMRSS